MAVIDRIRRVPLVANRQGRVALRDLDIAGGRQSPAADEAPPDPGQIDAAFEAAPVEALAALQQRIADAGVTLREIEKKMRESVSIEAAPTFDALLAQLGQIDRELRTRVAARTAGAATDGDAASAGAADGAPAVGIPLSGAVRSRADAIRALDAVAAFFRQTEPSSPVPLFVERAKRLVAKDFLEVLADIAPEALATARAAGGVKSDQAE
jgi:type VI secretion system protein ImpA